jgi:hypothetical protein
MVHADEPTHVVVRTTMDISTWTWLLREIVLLIQRPLPPMKDKPLIILKFVPSVPV